MIKNPWLKFYPQDWLGDKSLRFCSPAARGLWIDMLCVMHQAEGYLVNDKGHPVTDRMLVALTGIDESTVCSLKAELENNGVYSINNKGVIYSRRMVNDVLRARKMRKNGKRGGNPTLCNDSEINTLDNQNDNQEDKPQIPDTKKDLAFRGKVIRLKDATFDKLLAQSGMDESDFAEYLDGEDESFSKLPPAKKAKWFFYLSQNIKKMESA